MSTKVTRKQAEAVLADIKATYASYITAPTDGPQLRTNDHEELPTGCWSIDWEEGPTDWTLDYSQARSGQGQLLEPINHIILGVYPV